MLVLVSLVSCKDDPEISKTPEISFGEFLLYKNISGKDSMIVLRINYEDGDGDLGLSSTDTLPPYNYGNSAFYNLFVTYQVNNGIKWEKILNPSTSDTIHYNQRFPRLNLTKKDKHITGFMDLKIPASPYPGIKPSGVRFGIVMMDRALHKSNAVSSGDIFLKQ